MNEMPKLIDSIEGIPCSRCLIQGNTSRHHCIPETCDRLTIWLHNEVNMKALESFTIIDESEVPKPPRCPHCNSENVVRSGFYRYKNIKKQTFRCNNCGRRFRKGRHMHIRMSLMKFRTPLELIRYAFMLKAQANYSTRAISAKIEERFNKKISHVTVADWLRNDYLREKLGIKP